MASQVFDLRTSKGMTRGQSNEHLRCFSEQAFEAKLSHNFDPSREQLNFEVKPGCIITPLDKSDPIDVRITKNLEERGIKDPNEGLKSDDPNRRNTVIDIIFEGSRERMRELAFGDQEIEENNGEDIPCNWHITRRPEIEEWARDMYKFACDKFGEKNVAAFVVHLDELNPHAHCTIIPTGIVKGKERISAKKVMGQSKHECRDFLRKMHDDLAIVNKKWGLERGQDINITGAKHRTTEQYWKWLTDKCNELEKKHDGLDKEVRLLEEQKLKAYKAVKGLETMIDNLNNQINDMRVEISYLENDTEQNQEAIKQKEAELKKLQSQLDDKNHKLVEAQKKLWDLSGRLVDAENRLETTERRLHTIRPDANAQVVKDIQAIAWNYCLDECSRVRHEASQKRENIFGAERRGFDEYANIFGSSFLEDISAKGDEIIIVASQLFLGYIDAATKFAANNGGGGGPSGGWGRKKDENDHSFMGRCLIMARVMMNPSCIRKGVKR